MKLVTGPQFVACVDMVLFGGRYLCERTLHGLPTSHNSPCVLYVEVLEATAEGSSTGDKLS